MWGAGLLVARRTRTTAAAELRAELAERDRQEQARRAVEEERARIARELHDVVSHGLSVVVLQTLAARAALHDGGARRRPAPGRRRGDRPRRARRDAPHARPAAGRRPDRPGAPPATQPGLHSLPALVDRAAAAGLRIPADLPAPPSCPAAWSWRCTASSRRR